MHFSPALDSRPPEAPKLEPAEAPKSIPLDLAPRPPADTEHRPRRLTEPEALYVRRMAKVPKPAKELVPPAPKVCVICAGTFTPTRNPDQTMCSKPCMNRAKAQKRKARKEARRDALGS